MTSEGQELGKGVFGYRRSAVNQIIADRDIMLRQAEGRVRAAESKVAELEGEMGSMRERNSRMEEQLERLRTQLDLVVERQGTMPPIPIVETAPLGTPEPDPSEPSGSEPADPAEPFAVVEDAPDTPPPAPAAGDDEFLFESWDSSDSGQDDPQVPRYEISDDGGLYDIPSAGEDPEPPVPPLFDGADDFDAPPSHPDRQAEAEQQVAEEAPYQTEPEHTHPEEVAVAAPQESPMEFGQNHPFETDASQSEVMTPGAEEHPSDSPGWSQADVPAAVSEPEPEPEPDRTAEMTSRFLSDEIAGILSAAEESAARIVERARESVEQQVAEADRLWREVQAEVARFAAWREQIEPVVLTVQAKVNDVRSQVEDVPERIRQALAPMADAISSIDADLAELASVGNPPLLLTPSGLKGETEYQGSDAGPEPRSWFAGTGGETGTSGGFYGSDAPYEDEGHGPEDSGMGANAG
jgi:hypothetical protein